MRPRRDAQLAFSGDLLRARPGNACKLRSARARTVHAFRRTEVVTQLRAVLFDLDGTLVDTAPDITAAMNRALEEFQLGALPQREIAERIGKGPRVLVQRVLAAHDILLDDVARARLVEPLLSAYLGHYQALIGSRGRLFPHVIETLQGLRARGLKIGVVTNALQQPAQSILSRYRIAELIDLVLGGDMVRRTKPHPEILEKACDHFGVGPREALMVGDSANDVLAARAAGCDVVCVPYGYNEGNPLEALGCEILENIESLPAWIDARGTRLLTR